MSVYKKLTVEEFTTPYPYCVVKDAGLETVFDMMVSRDIRHVLVLNEHEKICGIISERDILSYVHSKNFLNISASDVMTTRLLSVSPEAKLSDVALEMSKNKIGSAIVIDEKSEFCGIFTATDALNALVEVLRGDLDKEMRELS